MTEYDKLKLASVAMGALAIVSQYSYSLRTSTDTAITGVTPLIGSAVSLGSSYPYVQSLTGCFEGANASNLLPTSNYTISEGGTSGGYITLAAGSAFNNTAINCSTLTYLASNSATTAATKFTTGLTIFATFAAVLALALVGKLIVNIFRKKN